MNRFLCIMAALLIAACAGTAGPDDLIRTPEDAIRVAKQVCGPDELSGVRGHWKARLEDGSWGVGYYVTWDRDECPAISATIRAHDGLVWNGSGFVAPGHAGCVLCVG